MQWGLIGDLTSATSRELNAGITLKVVRVSWSDFEPTNGSFSQSYLTSKLAEISLLRAQGMKVILDLGLQSAPAWIHAYPNSYLVDQYGENWSSATDPGHEATDESDADLIFNPQLRTIAATYIRMVADTMGSDAYAIRVGGGRFNELGYPTANTVAHTNVYWAYDALAQASSPVPGWRPGDASPDGQAAKFLTWYLQSIVNYEQWQLGTLREDFTGNIIVLEPGWGIRPGQVASAIADDLDGGTSAEINGEIQMGHDFADEVSAITFPRVWVETTWLDAAYGNDASSNPDDWNPVHYLASLVRSNPLKPELWGENTGGDTVADMVYTVGQARKYDLAGVVWYDEQELLSGDYPSLPEYAQAAATP